MACGGSDLSTRMSTEVQNIDKRLICEIALKHFKKYKVEISDAIKTTFPFLELLRDRGFITNKLYEDFLESSRNLVSIQRVVYNVLNELEKTFDLPLLEALFSDVFMRNYPDLNDIRKSFQNVIQEKIFHQASDKEESVDSPNNQLSLKQGTGENFLTWLCPNAWHYNVRGHEDSSEASVKETLGAWSSELGGGPAEEGTVDRGNDSTLRKSKRKKRGPRKHTDGSVDFHSEVLPVTCGEMKGLLHKNILLQGATAKSIKRDDGKWFTPREFEVAGGYDKSSNWKLSVRCAGKTLKWLMEQKLLPKPPRIYGKKQKMGNSDECDICQDGGTLFCCDTCSRSFHEECHIPPVDTQRNPWSCTFCRTQKFLGSQKCHRVSEVLEKQMGPEEQLKCEFLLLKIYCYSEINIFKKSPRDNYQSKETSQCMKELMMFNEIKKKLNEWSYPQVGEFVQDMYLIFQKHRTCNKCNYYGLMGIKLEAEFEKNFSEVFAVQATNVNSSLV